MATDCRFCWRGGFRNCSGWIYIQLPHFYLKIQKHESRKNAHATIKLPKLFLPAQVPLI